MKVVVIAVTLSALAAIGIGYAVVMTAPPPVDAHLQILIHPGACWTPAEPVEVCCENRP